MTTLIYRGWEWSLIIKQVKILLYKERGEHTHSTQEIKESGKALLHPLNISQRKGGVSQLMVRRSAL